MNTPAVLLFCGFAAACVNANADDTEAFMDRVDEALSGSSWNDTLRTRLSGTIDLEDYVFNSQPPGLIYSDRDHVFNPRLNLFFDGQWRSHFYAFAQARVDQGFDPSEGDLHLRMDEYAIRITPWASGVLNLQLGKFGTVIGNWVPRHHSWENPFVTAPLPYENLTGIFDASAASSAGTLLNWANLGPNHSFSSEYPAQLRMPIIWGPSYSSGAALTGTTGKFDYAVEMKNTSLSSRPEAWDLARTQWQHPTYGGRLGYRPREEWNFGFSASSGSYLLHSATPTLATGTDLDDYREVVIGQDISYAWHHLQLWAEFFETRFDIPRVGHARTFAYYVEARYKFTPQFSGAVRWNEQLFGRIPLGNGGSARWGRNTWRVDIAPTYRFTAHLELKLQYSLQHAPLSGQKYSRLFASQLVLRF